PHHLLNRCDNVGVSAAAANIATHELADFLCGFCPTLRDQPCRRANLPRRAVAALERIMVDERLLQRMPRALCRDALDRGCLRSVVHDGKRQARIGAPPVDEHGAGAALALIAAFFRPRQVQMLAQQVKERCAGIEHEGMMRPIDDQAHRDCLRRRQTSGRHPQLLLMNFYPRPVPSGSFPRTKTMGMTDVACFIVGEELHFLTMTWPWRLPNSAAIWLMRSGRPSDQRYSIARVRPSIQPRSCSRATKAVVQGPQADAFEPTNPIVGSLPACCARAARGHAAAAPPSVTKNFRRATWFAM